jgi:flagellar motor component MotA
MNRFYFPALILVLAVIVLAIVFSAGNILYFLDGASMVVTVVPTVLLCFATFTPADIGRSFRAAFSKAAAPEKDLKVAILFFRAMQRYLFYSAAFGALTGAMVMFASTQDLKAIGTGFAILLVCVFYSVVLNMLVAFPFRISAERKLAELGASTR